MSEPSVESTAPNLMWDIIRYVIVAIGAGFLIYYCFFHTPTLYVSREHAGQTMGTDYIVKVAQFPENGDWEKVVGEIQNRLDALDQMMSTYKEDSEVCRFNASASTGDEDWFSVSPETAQIVQTALEISQLTDGAFDITVAPLVRHWGFGAGASPRRIGSFEELASAAVLLKERTSWEKLSVQLDPPALKKEIPELTIDLSAIAKGFAVDSIAVLLEEQKIEDYMIEVGGEVRSKGKKSKAVESDWTAWMVGKANAKEKDWIAGIEQPLSDQFSGVQQAFPLKDQSLATSGSYLQFGEIGGRRVSHIIDPRSGLPAQIGDGKNELVSVAVLAPNCTRADALATALFVLGEQEGREFALRHKIAVVFLLRTDNEIREVSSDAWTK